MKELVNNILRMFYCSYGVTKNDLKSNDIADTYCEHFGFNEFMKLINLLEIDKNKRALLIDYIDDWFSSKEKKDYSEELLNKNIFLGNGILSFIDCNHLHKELNFALRELGSMQQNGILGSEFDEGMQEECKQNIKNVLVDFCKAFDVTPEDLK